MIIPEEYLVQIQAAHPEVDVKAMRINRDGLVNDVVIVNDEWCFRFPKNAAGKADLRYESKLLDLVARYVSMPVPVFTWRWLCRLSLHPGRTTEPEHPLALAGRCTRECDKTTGPVFAPAT